MNQLTPSWDYMWILVDGWGGGGGDETGGGGGQNKRERMRRSQMKNKPIRVPQCGSVKWQSRVRR